MTDSGGPDDDSHNGPDSEPIAAPPSPAEGSEGEQPVELKPGGGIDWLAELKHAINAQSVLVPIYAVLLAVVVGGIFMLIVDTNPFEAYWALLRGMVGTPDRINASLGRATPYIGAALAVGFAFRAGLFNIGAEGQLLVGATTAAWVGTYSWLEDVPGPIVIPLILTAGVVGGAVFGGIPGFLKAKTGAHEVITTIMLNNIAILIVRWMVNSQDPVILRDMSASVPRTARIPDQARLPEVVSTDPPLHLGFFVAIALCALVWFILRRTNFGFVVRTVGTNPNAAKYAGMSVNGTIIAAMALSGAFAGLAGAGEVTGTSGFLSPGTFANIGFDAIAIALLARANPFGIVLTSLLWGSMLSGAGLMQQDTGLSIDTVRIVQSMVLLFVAADVIVRTIFRVRKRRDTALDTTSITSSWGAAT